VSVANVRILNNFAPPSFAANEPVSGTLPKHLAKAPGAFRVLFAGNLGRFQGLETVVAALPLLDDLPDFRLEFLGNGVGRESLQRLAGHYVNQKVFFHGYEPLAVAKQVIATADLGLVSLNPEIYRAAYPSKVMTYLLGGTPILALVESRSELARMIDREGIGYHVPQNDPGALADTIRRAYRQRDCSGPVRARALALGERDFSPQAALSRWAELFAELASDPNARSRA